MTAVKHFAILLLAYVLLTAQVCVRDMLVIGRFSPDFLALLAVVCVLSISGWPALVWASLAGLLSDCLASGPLGIDMLTCTLMALVAQKWTSRPSRSSPLLAVTACFLIVLTLLLTSAASRVLLSGQPIDVAQMFVVVTGNALYSSGLGLVAYGLWRGFHRRTFGANSALAARRGGWHPAAR